MERREALEGLTFPSSRLEVAGSWRAVQIEPIAGSGERLTVAVATLINGTVQIRIAPRIDRMNCLYGVHADKFVKVIYMALDYIRERLNTAADFFEHPNKLPGSTIFLSAPKKFLAKNIDESFNMAFKNFSSFAEWNHEITDLLGNGTENVENYTNTIIKINHGKLIKDVETAFIKKIPMSEDRFNRSYNIASRNRPTKIDYVGKKIVANFSIIKETRIEEWIHKGKAHVLDLKLHMDFSGVNNNTPHELLIYAPTASNRDSRKHKEVTFAIEELESVAGKTNIGAYTLHSAEEIGEYLAEREAA